jgi:hypothetical protein
MDLENKHKSILTQVLFNLLDKNLIDHPHQVAIGVLNLSEFKEKYEYFSSDAFQVLNYMHPLLELNKSFKRQKKMYSEIDENPHLKDTKFNGIDRALNGIGKSYERLRRIKIQNSVSSIFFQECLKENTSQKDKHISPSTLDYIEKDPFGKLLVDLEEILFLWGNNPYYQCTFYNYKENGNETIYHTIVFCQEKHCEAISDVIKKIIVADKDAELLEDIIELYQPLIASQNVFDFSVINSKLQSYYSICESTKISLENKPAFTKEIRELIKKLTEIMPVISEIISQEDPFIKQVLILENFEIDFTNNKNVSDLLDYLNELNIKK